MARADDRADRERDRRQRGDGERPAPASCLFLGRRAVEHDG